MKNTLLSVAIALLIASPVTQATTITYAAADVSGDTWRYDYTVMNNSLATPIEEITIFFPVGQFVNLGVAGSPPGWDSLVAQPDPGLPADGFFDSAALTGGIGVGQSLSGFSSTFNWLGSGAPGPLSFEVVDPNTFATLESGTISPVPLPDSWVLLFTSLGALLATARYLRLIPRFGADTTPGR